MVQVAFPLVSQSLQPCEARSWTSPHEHVLHERQSLSESAHGANALISTKREGTPSWFQHGASHPATGVTVH